jgi:hypothetical protein
MSEGIEKVGSKSWLSEAVILFLAPALAYFLAFKYEQGYCGTFGVPYYFIKPDLTEILIFTSVAMGYSITLFYVFDAWFDNGKINSNAQIKPWLHLIVKYLPLFCLFGFIVIIYAEFWHKWSWFFCLFGIIIGLDTLVALTLDSNSKSFTERLVRANAMDHPSSIFFKIRSRIGRAGALLISFVFLGSILATFIGNSEALHQTSFLVPSSNTNAIVIRSFGDKLICVEIDPKSKIPTKTFFILSTGVDNNLRLNLQKIGPLNFN